MSFLNYFKNKNQILVLFLLSNILFFSFFLLPKDYLYAEVNSYNLNTDWRWVPTGSIGDSILTTALANGVDSGSLSVLSNQTKDLILSLDGAPNGGIFSYSLDGADQSAWTITASQSFNSTNGTDGIWNSVSTNLQGDEYGPTDRLHHINISASNSNRWFKFSITNNYSSSQSLKNIGLHKFSTNNDYWVFVGASLVNMAVDYRNMNDAIKSEYGYDPIIFNTGVSGTNINWLNNNIDTILSAHPNAKFIAIDMGGNDVSFNRPYSSTTQSMRDSFVSDFRSVIQKIQNSGKIAIPARMTFRNYPHEYPGKPGVYGGGMEQNGSLPFNIELLDPIIADLTPDFYDASAGHGAVDLYNYFLNNQWVLEGTDGVHPNVLGREFFDKVWRDTAFHFAYSGSIPGAITPQIFNNPAEDASDLVLTAESSRETSDINIAQAKLTELNSWPEFSSEQSSLQARLNNVIPTSALFYLVDFGKPESNYITTPNWNNLTVTAIDSSIDLITDAGAISALKLKITYPFTGITTITNPVLDFIDLPFNAERDGFVVRGSMSQDSVLTLSGLNLSKKYTFILYSGATFITTGNTTDFTINGVKKSVISDGNTSQLVQFDNIVPSVDGEIVITVGTDTNFGIVNALSIRETENPPTCIDGILNQDETFVDVGGVCGVPITLTYTAGAHGSLTGSLSQTINSGANGSPVTAIADVNYHFVNWSDGSTENPITHNGATSDINLTANFAINQNTLTYIAGGNGSISGNLYQSVNYNSNGSAVTAVPSNGYHFVNWSDSSVQNPRTDLNVVANISVTANFLINTPTCSDGIKNQNETGIDTGGICSVRTYLIDFGSSSSPQTTGNWNNMTNPLTPSSISDIIDNTGASSLIDLAISNRFTTFGALGVNTITGVYPQNVVLDYFYVQNGSTSALKFSSLSSDKTYNFNFFASRAGTGTRNSEFIINGVSVVLNAMNNSNNIVSITGVSPDSNGEISVTIRPEGSATYAYLNAIEIIENPVIVNHTLTYTSGSNGTITGSTSQVVNHGADGTEVTAVPNTNYHFVRWSDNIMTASRKETNVIANKSIIAIFTINNHTLTYTSGSNGTITGSTSQVVNHGADGTEVTAVPNTNYHFTSWSDGVLTAARTDTSVTVDKSVTANFEISEIIPDNNLFIIQSILSSPSNRTSNITWETNQESSSIVEYGLTNDYGSSSLEENTSPMVINHSIDLLDLVACTTYHYRVKSINQLSNTAIGSDKIFTTTGCTGSSSVTDEISTNIISGTGGSTNLVSAGVGLQIDIPSGAIGADAVFQIKELNQNIVFASSSIPNGVKIIGNYAFDLKALTGVETLVTSFLKPIEVTLKYKDSDVIGINESTLVIYRYDGVRWSPLSDCVVSSNINTINCNTSNFSVFSLFSTTQSSSLVSGSSVNYGCKDLNALNYEYFASIDNSLCKYNKINKSFLTRNLKYGMKGEDIKKIQQYLNTHNFIVSKKGPGSIGNETNVFGSATKAAVIKFQKLNKLVGDGIIGQKTFTLMK